MARNVEIKARVADLEALERRAAELSDSGPAVLHQEDVFFECSTGRLKLRSFTEGHGELIYYERPAQAGPTASDYSISETPDARALRETLCRALEVTGTVRKERRVYLAGQTRIHLDRVEALGNFMELEVVLRPGQSASEGTEIAERLIGSLGINERDLVHGAYIDLLHSCPGESPHQSPEPSPGSGQDLTPHNK